MRVIPGVASEPPQSLSTPGAGFHEAPSHSSKQRLSNTDTEGRLANFQPTVSRGLGSWVVGRERNWGVKRVRQEHISEVVKAGTELFPVLEEHGGWGGWRLTLTGSQRLGVKDN